MARTFRIEFRGACYHVINRGNYKRNLFGDSAASEAFERTLAETAQRFGWKIHAYVVMRNHFHLAVEISEPNLSEGMKWLQGTWVRRYNGLRRIVGRPFQGRYKALLVEPGEHLGRVCHYIHLNPVRAKVVEAGRAMDFRWSSLPKFMKADRPGWLEASTVLEQAGRLSDTPAGWGKYVEYLEFLATDKEAIKALVAKKLSQGWCVGTKAFLQDMRNKVTLRGMEMERYAGLEPAEVQIERRLAWEEKLLLLAEAAKIDLSNLAPAKSAPEKVLLAAALKRTSSVPNGWLAKRLGMGKPASASQFVRHWELDEKKRQAIDHLLSNIKT